MYLVCRHFLKQSKVWNTNLFFLNELDQQLKSPLNQNPPHMFYPATHKGALQHYSRVCLPRGKKRDWGLTTHDLGERRRETDNILEGKHNDSETSISYPQKFPAVWK